MDCSATVLWLILMLLIGHCNTVKNSKKFEKDVLKILREIDLSLQDVSSISKKSSVKLDRLIESWGDGMTIKFQEDTLDLNWRRFHTYKEIHAWLDVIAEKCGKNCHTFSIGQTYENRALKMIKIGWPGENRRSVYIDCLTHAREWVTTSIAVYLIGRLILDVDVDENTRNLREAFDWYILPIVNPDGYEFSRHTRSWRKNRQPNPGSECAGTDINRNFEYKFNHGGSSMDPCSEVYMGSGPLSSLEAAAVGRFLVNKGSEIDLALNIHSYGQFLLIPFGYNTEVYLDNFEELVEVADITTRALSNVYGMTYTAIHGYFGNISGTTLDFAAGQAGIRFAYLLETRDRGEHQFYLPPSVIYPTVVETWEGVKTLSKEVKNRTKT